jgi:hypothetical protein
VISALVFGELACQLFVDVGGLSNGQCPAGSKLCNGKCVSTQDPTHGCGRSDCAPCSLLNAYTGCDPQTLQCSFTSCVASYLYCGDNPANGGCPIDPEHDPNNCGGCDASCLPPSNGLPGCKGGKCSVGGCTAPYEDCDQLYSTGCETNLDTDAKHCGACGHACDAGVCSGGACQLPDAGVD